MRSHTEVTGGGQLSALLVLPVLLCLLCIPGEALDPDKAITQYNSTSWTMTEGLPQDSVLGIAQTADGYLWIGSRAGLGRFNGRDFTVFDPENAPGLLGRNISSLYAASDGGLWIGTDGKGVARLKDGMFTTLGTAQGLYGISGNDLYEDEHGDLWVATWTGVYHFHGDHATQLDVAAGIPHRSVHAITGDGRGIVWAVSSLGLAEIRDGRVVKQHHLNGETMCAMVDRAGRLWIGSSNGLYVLEGGVQKRHYTTEHGLLADFINVLAEDRDGNIWIGSESGLNRFSNGRIDGLSARDGLPGNAVDSLLEDREGNIWIGLRGRGLVRLSEGSVTTFTGREGLSEADVTCVFQASDGAIWIGSGQGLTEYRDGRFRTYTRQDGLLSEFITSIGEHSRYGLLVGTFASKLNVIRDGTISVFEPMVLSIDVPTVIYEDRSGTLWIGTVGAGLYRLDSGGVEHFAFPGTDGQYVTYDVIEDPQGVLWFATANGLLRHESGEFESVMVYSQGGNLGVNYCLYLDAAGELWVGTRDRGVCRLRDGEVLRCYSRADGLYEDEILHITEDDGGTLWMSSPRGLFLVERAELGAVLRGEAARVSCRVLGVRDGMMSRECGGHYRPSGLRATDGRLWFPTAKGVVVADPRRMGGPQPPPPVVIESVQIGGRIWDNPKEPITVGPGQCDIEISYAGLSYREPESIRYRTLLEGFSEAWSDAESRLRAVYTNLPPGRYVFRVSASTDGQVWSETPTAIEIRLAPHFYQTRASRVAVALLALLVFVAGAWGVFRWRIRRLKAHADTLAREVQEALANVRVLGGLLPICANCKKIRADEGYWEQIEAYISEHSEADFTHGICPECVHKLYPELAGSLFSSGISSPESSDTEQRG